MEELLMFDNLIIKSKISGTYKVDFISDLNQHLSIITTNSIFIIDSNILKLFPENFIKIKNNERLVIIESNEKNKTLDYCKIIIRHLIQLNVIFVTKFGEVPLTIKGSIEGPSHFSYIDVMNKNGQQKNIIPGNQNLADDIVEGKPIVTSIIKTIDKEDMINNI